LSEENSQEEEAGFAIHGEDKCKQDAQVWVIFLRRSGFASLA
jgi:hypothetical protein